MSHPKDHIKKACHNIEACSYLAESKKYNDWVVTTASYAGLHMVDAVVYETQEGLGRHGQSHDNRKSILTSENKLRKIWEYYRLLISVSVIARYMQDTGTPPDKAIDFDKYMPEAKLKALLKEQLGGLIQASQKFNSVGSQTLETAFKTHLGKFLGLT